jgi:hypothetical protein
MSADPPEQAPESEPRPLEYSGALTEDEFVGVHRLSKQLRPNEVDLLDYALVGGILFFAVGLFGALNGGGLSDAPMWILLGSMAILFWRGAQPDPRRLFQESTALRELYRGRLTGKALEARLHGVDSRIPWPFFTAYLELDRVILLVVGDHTYVPILRGFFGSDEDWSEARKLIGARLKRREIKISARFKTILYWLVAALVIGLFWSVSSRIQRGP